MTDTAQIYLKTPAQFDLGVFSADLARILDTTPIACLRLALASQDTTILGRSADALREICHQHDIAIVIEDHFKLVDPHGLDGVHLSDSSRSIRDAREMLGKDAIIGTYCGSSRHAGITAAEIGVDYVSFGPLAETGLGAGKIAPPDLFQWWSEMIEVPVVAEGCLNADTVPLIKDTADFVCIGDEIWGAENPQAALNEILALL